MNLTKLTAEGKWYRKVPIYVKRPTNDGGMIRIPLIYLADGRPGFIINQYIHHLLEEQATPSQLKIYVRALLHLYAFTMALYENIAMTKEQQESLLAHFISAKKWGTDAHCKNPPKHLEFLKSLRLNWPKTKDIKNIERYLKAINTFDEWQETFHGASRLNPSEAKLMSAWEIYKDFQNKKGWDPYVHLHAARDKEREEHPVKAQGKHVHQRLKKPKPCKERAFPLRHIFKLFECARNPRDELLLLYEFGGSARKSEPLHYLRQDYEGVNELGELKWRIDNCREGLTEWHDGSEMVSGTRLEYFQEMWRNEHLSLGHPLRNLLPRDMYYDEPLAAGFKGISFSESSGANIMGDDPYNRHYDVNYVWWLDPRIGARAARAYAEYRDNYLLRYKHTGESIPEGAFNHPWLFINITNTDDYGQPLTYNALKTIWRNLLERLYKIYGIDLRKVENMGMHSLRHLFGWYCASVLQLSLEETQALMHHASIESTKKYYRISPSVARAKLTAGYLESQGFSPDDINYIIPPNTPELEFPADWTCKQLQRFLLSAKLQAATKRRLPR